MRCSTTHARLTTWALAVLMGGAVWLTGCEDDHHHHYRPPPGYGTMLIDNDTDNDISVFIDGLFMERVARDEKVTPYDLGPGWYRVVLEERGGYRYFRGEIDILPGRNTVIYVGGYYTDVYYVDIFFD